jgi:uncharacterized membrane protein
MPTTDTVANIETREIEFIPAAWMEHAAWTPGLRVYSRPVRVPVHSHPLRRKTDVERRAEQNLGEIEQLIRSVLSEFIHE